MVNALFCTSNEILKIKDLGYGFIWSSEFKNEHQSFMVKCENQCICQRFKINW